MIMISISRYVQVVAVAGVLSGGSSGSRTHWDRAATDRWRVGSFSSRMSVEEWICKSAGRRWDTCAVPWEARSGPMLREPLPGSGHAAVAAALLSVDTRGRFPVTGSKSSLSHEAWSGAEARMPTISSVFGITSSVMSIRATRQTFSRLLPAEH